MMGSLQVVQCAPFYEFSFEDHIPQDHQIRATDRFVDLGGIRQHLAPLYSNTGRPSLGPELMILMSFIGYCFGTRSERRICEEVHLNLAYRWFCRIDLTTAVPKQKNQGLFVLGSYPVLRVQVQSLRCTSQYSFLRHRDQGVSFVRITTITQLWPGRAESF